MGVGIGNDHATRRCTERVQSYTTRQRPSFVPLSPYFLTFTEQHRNEERGDQSHAGVTPYKSHDLSLRAAWKVRGGARKPARVFPLHTNFNLHDVLSCFSPSLPPTSRKLDSSTAMGSPPAPPISDMSARSAGEDPSTSLKASTPSAFPSRSLKRCTCGHGGCGRRSMTWCAAFHINTT